MGPREKPHPLVLNKAETMKFDGGSSRVGKVVDSFLQTSAGSHKTMTLIELLKKRHLMDYVFFPQLVVLASRAQQQSSTRAG